MVRLWHPVSQRNTVGALSAPFSTKSVPATVHVIAYENLGVFVASIGDVTIGTINDDFIFVLKMLRKQVQGVT
ncbi:hypothetical protein EI94DRAFT_1730683 [Lactarius quietus]|nr:hypothetical protein EI94DRAFT_1730683 [Lactarius quietus]